MFSCVIAKIVQKMQSENFSGFTLLTREDALVGHLLSHLALPTNPRERSPANIFSPADLLKLKRICLKISCFCPENSKSTTVIFIFSKLHLLHLSIKGGNGRARCSLLKNGRSRQTAQRKASIALELRRH